MDPVSDILAHLDLAGMLYFTTEFSGDWGVRVPAYPGVIRFHLVMRGEAHIRLVDDGTAHAMRTGDFLMIPHGTSHDLLAHPDLHAPPLETVLRDVGYGGEGPLIIRREDAGDPVRLLCGHFSFAPSARGNALLRSLPKLLVARNVPAPTADWLSATYDGLIAEAEQSAPGHGLIIRRLTEILFVHALRLWMQQAELPPGVLRGLADRHLSRAIQAMHRTPESAWTVEALAREAGLSRSIFAERFRSLTGTSPLRYLTEWRMQIAHRMLASEGAPIDQVALAVGYWSTPAFSRVYTQYYGVGPGRTRREGARPVTSPSDDPGENQDAPA